ncbi:MAG: phosphatidylethanolamine N-methyltransferase family protein, partial [Alphaproteobacteria bacterium]|nr:phosphatidylethanolamine N-methyltransferase family protein [Alphaproteobacteria bacterium]
MNKAKRKLLFEKTVNLGAAVIYAFMAYRMGADWMETGRLSSLFFLTIESVVMCFFLIRDMPKQTSMQLYDWFVALTATCLPLFFRPTVVLHDTTALLLMQWVGILLSAVAVLFLNKSFGIVPANRGIKQGGLYRYVRHPIYAGYVITYSAYVLQNASPENNTVAALFLIFLILRILAEEEFLAKDPVYAKYMKQTRWRL